MQSHGKNTLVFDSENLAVKGLNLLKAALINDGVHKQEALASSHVLLSHCTVFLRNVTKG